jgi:hypothetical protein
MNRRAVLQELWALGIRVVATGDRLCLRGPDHVLTAELTEHLRQLKPEILEAVRHSPKCCECGAAIGPADPECWWGLDRVHLDCGKRASARERQGEVLPTDAPAPRC